MNADELATAVIDGLIVHPTQQPLLEALRPLVEAIVEQTLAILDADGQFAVCRECGDERVCTSCDAIDRAVCRECGDDLDCGTCGQEWGP